MIQFRFNHFWFVILLPFFCSVLYFIWPEKDIVLQFYKAGDGSSYDAVMTLGMTLVVFSVFVYMPFRILTEPFFDYWIEDETLYIKKFGRIKAIPVKDMVHVLLKPVWTRWMGAPYMLFYYGDKRYRIPSGFYLAPEDYKNFKQRVSITEQGNFEVKI